MSKERGTLTLGSVLFLLGQKVGLIIGRYGGTSVKC